MSLFCDLSASFLAVRGGVAPAAGWRESARARDRGADATDSLILRSVVQPAIEQHSGDDGIAEDFALLGKATVGGEARFVAG
jgi:hypothetical protein